MATAAPAARFRQQGRADRDRRRRRAREADRQGDRHRGDGGRDPARRPRPLRRRERHPRQARPDHRRPSPVARRRGGRGGRGLFQAGQPQGRAEAADRTPRSATSSSIRCRRSSSAGSPPRPPSRSSSRRSATPSASASMRSSRTAPARSSPASSSGSSSATSSSTSAAPRASSAATSRSRARWSASATASASLILSRPPREPRPADLPVARPSRLHEEAVRAGSAGDLRRHHRDQGRRPRSGQPRQDRRASATTARSTRSAPASA